MFEARNIAFAYGKRDILRDVSFVVSPGEIVSLLGANGCGKTTLMRVLATLLTPDSGQVLYDGQDAFKFPIRYRRQLGYLPENIALYDDMTVKEYLVYRARLKGEPAKRIRRRVSESCDLCRIADGLLRCPIRTLSLGMKKRVALADALLLRPRVLLLDDFLAGLDLEFRQAMVATLSEATAFSSVIVTGHELEAMAGWTSRFLVLRDGVIGASITASGVDPATLRERVEIALIGGNP